MTEGITAGFIFARGGSKGLPRKNVRPIAGRPLIEYAIEVARASTLIDRVIVSTDDHAIAAIARASGAEVPFIRPGALAVDDAVELLAWKHALRALAELGWPPIGTFVSVPTTAPLRRVSDVDGCIKMLRSTGADIALTVYDSGANPYFNLVVERDGWYHPFGDQTFTRRQDAPRVMQITPVAYAARVSYVLETHALLEGRVAAFEVPPERALDIDTEHEFRLAETILGGESRAAGR